MRAVARRAGSTYQAPDHYFADRDSILAALVAEGFGELAQLLRQASDLAPTSGVRAALIPSGLADVAFALVQHGVFRIMFRPDACNSARFPDVIAAGARSRSELDRLNAIVHGDRAQPSRATLRWARVHGQPCLLVDGPLAAAFEPEPQRQRHQPVPAGQRHQKADHEARIPADRTQQRRQLPAEQADADGRIAPALELAQPFDDGEDGHRKCHELFDGVPRISTLLKDRLHALCRLAVRGECFRADIRPGLRLDTQDRCELALLRQVTGLRMHQRLGELRDGKYASMLRVVRALSDEVRVLEHDRRTGKEGERKRRKERKE